MKIRSSQLLAASLFHCFLLLSCRLTDSSKEVDTILYNATIYTVDSAFMVQEAMAIREGKIVALGTNQDILGTYQPHQSIDVQGGYIYPGLHDAHCHFYNLGQNKQWADLVGTKSFEEVVRRLKEFRASNPSAAWLLGRGWDQNDWEVKEFPTKELLDEAFPNVPVKLVRIDGHAILVNQKALNLAGITAETQVEGGEIKLQFGKPTGVLVDNAMSLIDKIIPPPSKEEIKANLKAAEQECLQHGLTAVTDAGLPFSVIQAISEMQQRGQLAIRISAMVLPSELPFWQANGKIREDRLRVHSVKIYADGALGSRGACLLAPYSDAPQTNGFLLKSPEELEKNVRDFAQLDFQINTHCIGDSANRIMLTIYSKYLKTSNDKRWRIEHAQVVHPNDFSFYGKYNIIPSMQPTHATSDMYWAKDRLGKERIKYAYALKDLMRQNGIIALGSDFPVEEVNPFLGLYAAVVRQDTKGFPQGGFQMENALDRESALKGMTIWAAYATFWEKEIGSLEVGKWADFIITDQNLMEIPAEMLKNMTVKETWIGGKRVFKK